MKFQFLDYFTSYIPFKKGKHGIFRVGKTNVNVKFDNLKTANELILHKNSNSKAKILFLFSTINLTLSFNVARGGIESEKKLHQIIVYDTITGKKHCLVIICYREAQNVNFR